MLQTEFQDHQLFGPTEEEFSRFYHIDHFCIKKVRGVWLLASPILIIFILGTSNKGQGGLFTSFSIH